MNPKATKSTFGSIHLTLAAIAASVVVGFFLLSEFFVAPQLVEDRAQGILSVIRSQQENVVLNKTRPLRDELLKSKAIEADQHFSHYFSNERESVTPHLANCKFISESICIGNKSSVFYISNSAKKLQEDFKFAVVLAGDLSQPPLVLKIWQGVIFVLTCVAFLLLHKAISLKETYLVGRLSEASAAFRRAQVIFSDDNSEKDEFETFGKSAENLVKTLEDYKSKFERKTRLEQLGLTVGQVSHDLKAPLNEADNFLSSLPLLLDTISRDKLEEATSSIIDRIRGGKEALNNALQRTKQYAVAREEVVLGNVLDSIKSRASENSKLRNLSFTLKKDSDFTALADRLRLETALINLLENTAEEKPNAAVQISLDPGKDGHAKITYVDNGGGIPAEYLEKVFEPLVTFKPTGTGLGLSSTKEILLQHGAKISALPYANGAKFEISIPVTGGANA